MSPTNQILLGNLTIDMDSFDVRVGPRSVYLNRLEFDLLKFFAANRGKIIEVPVITKHLWHQRGITSAGNLRIHIYRLRKKLDGSKPWQIKNVPTRGYGLIEVPGEIKSRAS